MTRPIPSTTAHAIAQQLSAGAQQKLLTGRFPVPPSPYRMELLHFGVVNDFGELRPFGTKVLLALQAVADHSRLPARPPAARRVTKRQVGQPAPRLEKNEQADINVLLESLGWAVYTIGTKRPGSTCPNCGTFVLGHQGTCQTEGIADTLAFSREDATGRRTQLWVEAKRSKGGRLSEDQKAFRALCLASGAEHVVGALDAVIAWLIEHRHLRADQVAQHHLREHAS